MVRKRLNGWRVFVHVFEHVTDHIIPYLVILLAIVLVLENPFWVIVPLEEFEPWIGIFDGFVVFFFVVDLCFKWFRTRSARDFFRLYWLDVLAVFPFYLVFRAYLQITGLFRIGEELSETAQKLAHEAVLLREARLAEEAEKVAREARIAREMSVVGRSVRSVQRLLRVVSGRLKITHAMMMRVHEEHKRLTRR